MTSLTKLKTIMSRLRAPDDGCPWDLRQTMATIVPHTIEEAYEVADAVETQEHTKLPDELGDLLFQVVFLSRLGEEAGTFTLEEVIHNIEDKLVRRHPHVFASNAGARSDVEVAGHWETLKSNERREAGASSELDDVPIGLPALSRAAKLQKRAARTGFDWPQVEGALEKVAEEHGELLSAIKQQDHAGVAEELGDLMFSVVNVARHLGNDPEQVLRDTNRRFERRFRAVEAQARDTGRKLDELTLDEMELLWQAAKKAERNL